MDAILPALATAVVATAAPDPVEADIAWVASGGFCEPETVLPLPDSSLLVSNVCGFRDPGNGFLTLLGPDGEVLDWRVVDGLDAPLGMALSGSRLYVIDNNRLKIFSWPGYRLLESIDIETEVANDLAVSHNGMVYVSDSAKHEVVRLEPDGTQSVLTGKAQFPGANGIELDGDRLFVGGERLWRVDLTSGAVSTIGPEWMADIDGIEIEADGTLQLTPVGGPLIRYRNDDEIEILAGPGISSANHGYSVDLNLALIPTGFDNTVVAIRIKSP